MERSLSASRGRDRAGGRYSVGVASDDGTRHRVEIEYCTQCGWLARAAWVAQELLGTFQDELAEVALVPGRGGVFDVRVDGETVFSRREAGGFFEPADLKQAVRDRIAPGRPLGHVDR